jgi:hypothetical protein
MISPSRALLLWAARLYPLAWRERYGEEFTAMIEDLPEGRARWATVGDILRGAVFMRVRSGVMGMAVMGGLAGLVMAAVVSMAVPDRYVTESLVRVESSVGDEALTAMVERTLEPEKLERVAAKYGLYGGGEAAARLQKDLRVAYVKPRADGSRAIRIGFAHGTPEVARQVASEMTTALLQAGTGLQLLDAPALPLAPFFPNRLNILIFGCAMGLVAGVGTGYLRMAVERFRTRV